MEKITIQEFDEVYQLFKEAFIPEELRPYEKMKDLLNRKSFSIFVIREEEKIVAAILIWQFEQFVYLENFAVDKSQRGHGLGSKILTEVKDLYPEQFIVLEVENPDDEMKQRRIKFYQRNDFILNPFHYMQPSFRREPTGVDLMLMSYPQEMDVYTFDLIKKQIFTVVYNQMI